MTPTGTYLVDIYRPQAASISALANLCRLIIASITPLVSPSMQAAMGIGGLYTFWGGLLVVTAVPGVWWMTNRGYEKRLVVAPRNGEGAQRSAAPSDLEAKGSVVEIVDEGDYKEKS